MAKYDVIVISEDKIKYTDMMVQEEFSNHFSYSLLSFFLTLPLHFPPPPLLSPFTLPGYIYMYVVNSQNVNSQS